MRTTGEHGLLTSPELTVFVLMQATKITALQGGRLTRLTGDEALWKGKERVSDGGCDDGRSVRQRMKHGTAKNRVDDPLDGLLETFQKELRQKVYYDGWEPECMIRDETRWLEKTKWDVEDKVTILKS